LSVVAEPHPGARSLIVSGVRAPAVGDVSYLHPLRSRRRERRGRVHTLLGKPHRLCPRFSTLSTTVIARRLRQCQGPVVSSLLDKSATR